MSDDNVRFLMEVIQKFVFLKEHLRSSQTIETDESMRAFQKLDAARIEIKQYFPVGFNFDRELEKV